MPNDPCLTCKLPMNACHKDKRCPFTPQSTLRYVKKPKKPGVKRRSYWAKYYKKNRDKKLQAANDRYRRLNREKELQSA